MTNLQAIDLLKGLEQSLDDYCELSDEGKTAFGMAITALELFGNSEPLPSAESEPHWIPCSEKPDRRDVYRVTVQCEHVDGYPDYEVCYGEYDEENGWFLLGEPVGRIKMVAWMRIDYVEPYQPEEESGGLR